MKHKSFGSLFCEICGCSGRVQVVRNYIHSWSGENYYVCEICVGRRPEFLDFMRLHSHLTGRLLIKDIQKTTGRLPNREGLSTSADSSAETIPCAGCSSCVMNSQLST